MLLQEKRVAPKDAEDRKGWVKVGADERTENAIFFENTRSLESITRPQEASESDSERLSIQVTIRAQIEGVYTVNL
jgi:hypothetical protein